jgi:hypothetical protein
MNFKAAKCKVMLPNGRDAKAVPKAENWFSKIMIYDHVISPAWRGLSKTATDILIISIAKQGRAGAFAQKFGGRPVFCFTVSEGVKLLSVSRTTFCRAIKELVTVGFLDIVCPGGIIDGRGRSSDYTLGKGWQTWQSPIKDNRNILKARSMRRLT